MEIRVHRKKKTGVVLSSKMEKTIIARIDLTSKHAVYNKVIGKSSKVMVHDEKREAKVGDKILIEETRPLSKNKRWRLVEVLKK